MKLSITILICLLITLLLASIIIGHFLPPGGIFMIPVTISIMTGLILFNDTDFSILLKSVLSYLFIGLNDIGLKLFAGGKSDLAGMGWIHLFLFIGLVPCFIMLLISVFRDKRSSLWIKALSVLIFMLLIYMHLKMFKMLGVDVS
jgi:hypothetical protein